LKENAMQTKTLETLFHDTLKDIYFAEHQILKALPKMIAAATSADLKGGFSKHLHETEGQVKRLEQVFELIGKRPQGETCPAIKGILEEGAELMEAYRGSPALDAALAAAAQAVEHYEMARYGALRTWAELLGYTTAMPLLQETLDQEMAADQALSDVAVDLNEMAMAAE
jgi:ferritin-like metal-binding protein YciE